MHRADANQKEIVGALRKAGALVHITSQCGDGFPDLLVGWDDQLILMEVKDGSKKPSAQKLSPKEQAFFDKWQGFPCYIVRNPLEALVLLGAEAVPRKGD